MSNCTVRSSEEIIADLDMARKTDRFSNAAKLFEEAAANADEILAQVKLAKNPYKGLKACLWNSLLNTFKTQIRSLKDSAKAIKRLEQLEGTAVLSQSQQATLHLKMLVTCKTAIDLLQRLTSAVKAIKCA